MKTFHAYEIATDSTFHLGVDLDPDDNRRRFLSDLAALDDGYTYRTGTVQADNPEAAMNEMRAGRWDYTEVA